MTTPGLYMSICLRQMPTAHLDSQTLSARTVPPQSYQRKIICGLIRSSAVTTSVSARSCHSNGAAGPILWHKLTMHVVLWLVKVVISE